MTPTIEAIIQRGSDTDRQFLLDLRSDDRLGAGVNVVYIYYLENEAITYPNETGKIIYVGEAGRPSEATGIRFCQHTSTAINSGGDSGTIYCLSNYYWMGKSIKLKVFIVNSKEERKRIEREFLLAHVKKFGALPICQGTTGQNYKTSNIVAMDISEDINAHL